MFLLLVYCFVRETVSKLDMFKDLQTSVTHDIVLCLERHIYIPGEKVVSKGEIGEEMFIISYGRLHVDLGATMIYLGQGDYLGEQALLTSGKRNADVVCDSHCELLVWRAQSFRVLCRFLSFFFLSLFSVFVLFCLFLSCRE